MYLKRSGALINRLAMVTALAAVGPVILLLNCGAAYAQMNWGTPFQKDQCTKPGFRQYSAILWGIQGDWGTACNSANAPVANINGQQFKVARCVNTGTAEWGQFGLHPSAETRKLGTGYHSLTCNCQR